MKKIYLILTHTGTILSTIMRNIQKIQKHNNRNILIKNNRRTIWKTKKSNMEILRVENLSKIYGKGENEVRAVDNVSFSVEKGEFIGIIMRYSLNKINKQNIIETIRKDNI